MKTHCPHCQHEQEVDESMINRIVDCPACKRRFAVKRPVVAPTQQGRKMGCGVISLLLLIVAGGVFGYVCWKQKTSPAHVVRQLLQSFLPKSEQITVPPAETTPESVTNIPSEPKIPEPPSALPESTPSIPAPVPTPAVVPAPATPAVIDPLAWLRENRGNWPQEIALTLPVYFKLESDGQSVGSITLTVGSLVKLLKIEEDQVTVSYQGNSRTIPMDATDLLARARAAIDRDSALIAAAAARAKLPPPTTVAYSSAIGESLLASFAPTDTYPSIPAGPFVHPGLLNSEADFARMRARVREGAEPWASAYKALTKNWTGRQKDWEPHPFKMVLRGGAGENFATFANDIAVAYGSALRWKVNGDKAYADTAVRIFNAWGSTLERIGGDPNFQLVAINGYQFAIGAEIMRTYPGWAPADFAAFQKMMKKVFQPMCTDFLHRHMGRGYSFMWSNWDLASMDCLYAVGVLCDDPKLTTEAINFFYNGQGEGNIHRTVNFIHPGYLGQTQEAGRDQGHNTLSIALLASFCEMAWHQGIDLYGYSNNRFLAGAEYVAKYNLGNDVPFALYANEEGYPSYDVKTEISAYQRGGMRSGWEMIYNHYVNRKGLAAPWSAAIAAKLRPTAYDGQDQPGFDTLTASLDPIATGANPGSLTAIVTAQQPVLSWWGSAYATSYNVKRATAVDGPYATIATALSTNTYTDKTVVPDTTYYYVVTATLRPGTGDTAPSNVARATLGTSLHAWLKFDQVNGTTVADAVKGKWPGTTVNAPISAPGKIGSSIKFSEPTKQYVSLPEGIMSDLSDFTIATWIYLESDSPSARLFDFGTGTERYMFLSPDIDDKVVFAMTGCGHYGEQTITSSAPIPVGQWVHVAVTVNGPAGTLYINGAPVGERTNLTLAPFRLGATTRNYIGKSQFKKDPYFNGRVDDFRIYRGALTADEVKLLAMPNGKL